MYLKETSKHIVCFLIKYLTRPDLMIDIYWPTPVIFNVLESTQFRI
jgi:hypothetical protein